jgi:hypothetical protein
MTAWVLVPVLRSWRRRFPGVQLDLKEYTSADRMLDVLVAGGADIIVGPRPTRTDEHVELLGHEEIVVVASAEHRFSGMDAVSLSELSSESLVHYNSGNGFGVWADQFAAAHGVLLPEPTLRTGSPRTAAQLAAAGMGVAIVPFSALGQGGTVRSLDPLELRDVIAIVAAPHDELLRRFARDLKKRGLPESCGTFSRSLGILISDINNSKLLALAVRVSEAPKLFPKAASMTRRTSSAASWEGRCRDQIAQGPDRADRRAGQWARSGHRARRGGGRSAGHRRRPGPGKAVRRLP